VLDTSDDKYKSVSLTNDTKGKEEEEEEEDWRRIKTSLLTGDWLSTISILLIDFIISSLSYTIKKNLKGKSSTVEIEEKCH
jgi:hypothetical protein